MVLTDEPGTPAKYLPTRVNIVCSFEVLWTLLMDGVAAQRNREPNEELLAWGRALPVVWVFAHTDVEVS